MLRRFTARHCKAPAPTDRQLELALAAMQKELPNAPPPLKLKMLATHAISKFQHDENAYTWYLHRAAAYQSLGLPFFAIPDLETAHNQRAEGIDPRLKADAYHALARMPESQFVTFDSSAVHLNTLVTPLLSGSCGLLRRSASDVAVLVAGPNACPVDAATAEHHLGRGVVCKRALEAGDVVITSHRPFVFVACAESHCAECGMPFNGRRRFSCQHDDDCAEEFCSRECRTHATKSWHGAVCSNQGFRELELDVFARLDKLDKESADAEEQAAKGKSDGDGAAATAAQRAAQREATMLELLLLRVYAVCLDRRVVPSALPEIRSLRGDLVFETTGLLSELFGFYKRLTTVTKTMTTVSFEDVFAVYAKLKSNAVPDLIAPSVLRLSTPGSLINHSCEPNAAYVVDEAMREERRVAIVSREDAMKAMATGADFLAQDEKRNVPGGAFALQPPVKATRAVASGEELTVSYFGPDAVAGKMSFANRQALHTAAGFVCLCRACLEQR